MKKVWEALKGGIRIAHGYKKLIFILFSFNLICDCLNYVPVLVFPLLKLTSIRFIVITAFLTALLVFIVNVFSKGAIGGSIKGILLERRFLGKRVLKYGRKYFWPLLVYTLMVGIVVFLLTVPMMRALFFTVKRQGWSAISPGFWAVSGVLAVLLVIFTIFTSYGPIIIVLEDRKVFKALKETFKFVARYFRQVLTLYGIFLLSSLVGLGLGKVIQDFRETKMVVYAIGRVIILFWNSYIGIICLGAFMIFYLAVTGKPNPERE
jgi:hypothetical protein